MYSTHVKYCEILSPITNLFRGEKTELGRVAASPTVSNHINWLNSKLHKFKPMTTNGVIAVKTEYRQPMLVYQSLESFGAH